MTEMPDITVLKAAMDAADEIVSGRCTAEGISRWPAAHIDATDPNGEERK